MNRFILTTIVCFLFGCFSLFGQSSIGGKVVDAADRASLANASVVLLNAKDSVLISYTRTGDDGRFTLKKPAEGSFLLLITYPKYGEYNQLLEIDSPSELGQISLTTVSQLIEEVIVRGRIPVVVKGDTTEYDASSFAVEKNAKVEDLLKVLPGITVDANGKITAQGKTVEKVLVDGEEFFGDDPTLVTRSLRSDMVDKVQVYEKKSEEAERTGVDDGIRQQTINVTLKEDAKKGYFGKAEAAGGTDGDYGYYLGKLAFNRFQGKQKIGAFGLTSNTGEISLNWQEAERFNLSEAETSFSDEGGIMIMMGGGDAFSYWDGRGKPSAFNSGLSFTDSWNNNKHRLNLNYKYGRIENDVQESTLSQNNLPAGQINSDNTSSRLSDASRHRFNAKHDWNIDSLTTLTLNFSLSQENQDMDAFTGVRTSDGNNRLMNENERSQNSLSEKNSLTYNGYLTRRMNKPGRSISLRLSGDITENDGNSFLKSRTDIYQQGVLATSQLIDQMKDVRSNSNNLRGSLAYSEPITPQLSSSVSYEYTRSDARSINNSYNKDGNNHYNQLDQEFSNDFDFNTVRNAVNLSLQYKIEKLTASFTNNFRNDDIFQRNNYQAISVQRDFFTYNPRVNLRYNLSRSRGIGVNYNRSNQLPSLSQIQPLRQNTDPLNIVVGNETLTPATTDNYSLNFNSYDMMKGSFMYAFLSFGQTRNSIQQNVLIDQNTGIRTLFYENLEGHVSNNLNLQGGNEFNLIKKYQIKGGVGLGGSYFQYYNYINGALNENQNYNYNLRLSITKNTTKHVDFMLDFSPGWNTLNTSLQPEFNSSGFTYSSSANYKWYLPQKFVVYGDLSYTYEAPTKAFNEKFERVLFKPGVSKKFLKDESLMLDFYINDVFNQNKGFRRYQSGNMITQNTYNTISRYYMIKLSWDFTSMKGGAK